MSKPLSPDPALWDLRMLADLPSDLPGTRQLGKASGLGLSSRQGRGSSPRWPLQPGPGDGWTQEQDLVSSVPIWAWLSQGLGRKHTLSSHSFSDIGIILWDREPFRILMLCPVL